MSVARLWAAVAGVLAVLLVLEWAWPAGTAAEGGVPARVMRAAHGPAAPARDTSDWVATILARPVFSATRRPPRVAAGRHDQVAAGQARLAGILITGSGRHAIFAPEGGGKQLVLAEGATVNDSTIRQIRPDSVVMASGAVLRLTYDHNRVAGPPGFQAFNPGFQNPGFPNPGFPNPGFPNPGFPNPGMINPGFPAPAFQPGVPAPQGDDAAQPPLPLPLRGGIVPQRRE